jgi:hypothetical protein
MINDVVRPHRIHLLGDGRHEEDIAGAVIRPGHLLATTTGAEVLPNACGTVIPHNVAGGPCEAKFALEDALQGKTIHDSYAVGDIVGNVMCNRGDVVYAWLSEGETVTPGSFLTSNGDGALKVAGGGDYRIAKALEILDASDTDTDSDAGTADQRVRCRIL